MSAEQDRVPPPGPLSVRPQYHISNIIFYDIIYFIYHILCIISTALVVGPTYIGLIHSISSK